MTTTTLELQASGARAIASLREGDDSSLPLLVALHGGGFNRHYFDLPNHSLLDRAAANGFAALAIDRPGYGESTGVEVEEGWFPAQADALDGLIADAWSQLGGERPGIALIGHSFGATIAIRLATAPSWPLLALAISGSLDGPPPSMLGFAASIADAPPHAPIALEPAMVRDFFYGPDDTFDPTVLDQATISVAPAPAVEIREWAHRWPEEAASATATVEVPVHLRVAENDAVLDVSPTALSRFAASFTAAPSVDAAVIEGAGHNADHHRAGVALHLEQLAFAAAEARTRL